jgi:hypothetical protein
MKQKLSDHLKRGIHLNVITNFSSYPAGDKLSLQCGGKPVDVVWEGEVIRSENNIKHGNML